MKLTQIVEVNAIVPELRSAQRDDVVAELINSLADAGVVDAGLRDDLIAKVLERERRGSTGFGKGVAVPHVKHERIERIRAAVGLSASGVDFNALDKQPVYSVFLLLSPADKPEEHLRAMEIIFKSLSNELFRRFLRQATTVDEVRALLEEADSEGLRA